VSFLFWPIYSWDKSPPYPFDRKLGGPESLSGRDGEEKTSYHGPCRELIPGHSARSQVSMLTKLTIDESSSLLLMPVK
jgi:hypothetical protein